MLERLVPRMRCGMMSVKSITWASLIGARWQATEQSEVGCCVWGVCGEGVDETAKCLASPDAASTIAYVGGSRSDHAMSYPVMSCHDMPFFIARYLKRWERRPNVLMKDHDKGQGRMSCGADAIYSNSLCMRFVTGGDMVKPSRLQSSTLE